MLRDVSAVDPSTTLLGARSALPLVFAPTGFTRLMHTEGESAVGRVAERVGVPYALSTMGTTSVEALAGAAPGARRWFQLYLWRDREASAALVERARAAGYEALVLTVDTPVAGPRLRDVRNGFTIPPALSAADDGQRRRAPPLVGGPPHDAAAGVRLAALLGRHGRRPRRPRLRAGRRRWPTSGRCARAGRARWS